ncbi:MAG: uroporphyrinogen decarboxylase [Rhizobiales bacterium]|nr:uroporphyrinogen decarboxylase [Hyphomicrobiales bacterium]
MGVGRKALLDVLGNRMPERRPIWFMRQAGRYLPEYRELRRQAGSFLDLCYSPKLASQVTMQPIDRYDLDAAILFSDILVVPQAMGVGLRFAEGEGPILDVVADMEAVARLKPVRDARQVAAVCETVSRTRQGLPGHVALIGFCGAPWTVASYMIEGGSSEERLKARLAAHRRPSWYDALMDRLIEASCDYLSAQVMAGAEVLQIFDSWAGDLTGDVFEDSVIGPIRTIVDELRLRHPSVPVIVFARGAGSKHGRVAAETGAQAVGIEQAVELASVLKAVPEHCAVQGNLDPVALLAGGERLARRVENVIREVPLHRHVFNLGHGIKPATDPAHVAEAIAAVRAADTRRP